MPYLQKLSAFLHLKLFLLYCLRILLRNFLKLVFGKLIHSCRSHCQVKYLFATFRSNFRNIAEDCLLRIWNVSIAKLKSYKGQYDLYPDNCFDRCWWCKSYFSKLWLVYIQIGRISKFSLSNVKWSADVKMHISYQIFKIHLV